MDVYVKSRWAVKNQEWKRVFASMVVVMLGFRVRMVLMREIRGVKWKQVPRTSKEADLGIVMDGWMDGWMVLRVIDFQCAGEDCLDGVFLSIGGRGVMFIGCVKSPQ